MKKHLGLIVGMSLMIGGLEGIYSQNNVETSPTVENSTREVKYIDPFDESLPVVNYEDLTEEEKKSYDEFRSRRHPGDLPGGKHWAKYWKAPQKRNCGCNIFGNLFGGLFGYNRR